MRMLLCLTLGTLILASASVNAAGPGGLQVLEGYVHEPLQGIDSVVGKISKKDGLEIFYEIGSIPRPGGPAFGGQFSDRPQRMPKDQLRWYRETTVHGQPVHLAHGKNDALLVSFPLQGINFSTTVRTPDEMAQALLMILTYPNPVVEDEKAPR
ncbi:hypothetical protein [Lignipirellula cremea]|uniref:Uncharacterized protein n=1 Tax=Lignipirellula cremea TaxID=2528010 RepID=A0A518DP66_9BACT|nr:hypothetical protein [Lignipirellula cremea]QDU93603.1 hypothetical protein Pla8534_13830 [Lignipirellula cremea]